MFKYLWIIFFIGLGIVWGIASIIDVLKNIKHNYEYYIVEKHGTWKDVFNTWYDLENYSTLFFFVLIIVVIFGRLMVSHL